MFAAYQSHLTYDGKNPIEEFLQELRLEIEMSTADIASALESIMAKWKAISLGIAAFFVLPVMLLMARLSTIYRKKKRSINYLVIQVKAVKAYKESEKSIESQPVVESGSRQIQKVEDNIQSHYSPPQLPSVNQYLRTHLSRQCTYEATIGCQTACNSPIPIDTSANAPACIRDKLLKGSVADLAK